MRFMQTIPQVSSFQFSVANLIRNSFSGIFASCLLNENPPIQQPPVKIELLDSPRSSKWGQFHLHINLDLGLFSGRYGCLYPQFLKLLDCGQYLGCFSRSGPFGMANPSD